MDMNWIWFKDKDGRPDPILTFASLSVATVLFKLVFQGAKLEWLPHFSYVIQGIDAGTIGALFLPTLGAYVSNKYVNYNYHPDYEKMRKDINGDGKDEEVFVQKKDTKV